MMKAKTDLAEQRREKLKEIIRLGYDPYPHRYEMSHSISELVEEFDARSGPELESEPVKVKTAGRLMTLRGHGKASFVDLLGGAARLQVYVRQDRVGEENYTLFRLFDLGDIVGVEGVVRRTRTDELSIFADRVDLLAKGMLPLPEKWHGLSDVEIRYRQRYLDLIANPPARQIFIQRSLIISEIRGFLEARGYLEVETPMMQTVAGGATARPFKTFHEALGIPLFLRVAPELYLKRLVVGGFDRVFEINRNFRNEGISTQHNPEFTMLEFYQAYSDYRDLMDFTEEMLGALVRNLTGSLKIEFAGNEIDLEHFSRYSMVEAIATFWEGDGPPSVDDLHSPEQLKSRLKEFGEEVDPDESWGALLGRLFETVVEAKLIQPTFIYDFPTVLSPLSKRKDEDSRFAERFELFMGGMEIANAYSELNDPEEQEKRFQEQLEARARGDREAHAMDRDYVKALQYAMPPTAGEGIGIDRLTMLLTGSRSIREVILFPHLRPEESLEQ